MALTPFRGHYLSLMFIFSHPVALAEIQNLGPVECGKEAAKHFALVKGYTNLTMVYR